MRNKLELVYAVAAFFAIAAATLWTLHINKLADYRSETVASVNGVPISATEYTRALQAMQSGLERPLTQIDRDRALDILIDEELLVQQAIRLDLAQNDRLVRKNLVQAMINSATVLNEKAQPADAELAQFFEQEKSLFAEPVLLSLAVARSASGNDTQRFVGLLESGASFEVARDKANLQQINVPTRIPLGKVASLLGGSIAHTVNTMKTGDISGPVETSDGNIFIWLKHSEGGDVSFADARESVLAEWMRRQDEEALTRYLARLHRHARIRKAVDH